MSNGVSGTASFRATGELGVTKTLAQTVCPANRSAYTISAQVGSDGLVRGDGSRVGIEVEIAYDDGGSETRFIDLF
ncbi:MAG: hypothetical protein FWG25_10150 [Promicromonosporaceae bacterium]|nr:hypothetical protein [Promicromonosporaceae bacterium]